MVFIPRLISFWLSLFVTCQLHATVASNKAEIKAEVKVELYLVRPTKGHLSYLIPVRSGYTLSQEIHLYKQSLEKHPELSQVVSDDIMNQFKLGTVQKISIESELSNRTLKNRVLILANRGYDLAIPPQALGLGRIANLDEKIDTAIEKIILPVAATINLSALEKNIFYEKISALFNGVIALGGADIDPHLYNEKPTLSRDVNSSRDQYEIDFLKFWIQKSQGFLFGICRGHQLISAALGYKLQQHIDHHGDGQWLNHKVYVKPTKSPNSFQQIFNKNMTSFSVLSYHHQAVIYNPSINSNIEVAAVSQDGTVESLTSLDGRIFTTQFHPEFMSDYVSKKIFSFINRKIVSSKPLKTNQCLRLF